MAPTTGFGGRGTGRSGGVLSISHDEEKSGRLFLRLFFVVSAQVAPREDGLCGLRYSSVHHREVGVSRSDLRGAQGRVAHTWPLRLRWLGPEVCAYAG